jgi:hypothetical protein
MALPHTSFILKRKNLPKEKLPTGINLNVMRKDGQSNG